MVRMSILVEISYKHFRIHINGLLHQSIRLKDIVGIQSFIVGTRYFIEYTTKYGVIESDYDNRGMWEEILKQLAKINII